MLTCGGAVVQGHAGGPLSQVACVGGAAARLRGAPRAAGRQAAKVGAAQQAPKAPLRSARHHLRPQLRAWPTCCPSWCPAACAWPQSTLGLLKGLRKVW